MKSSLFEGAELISESGRTYLAVSPMQSNVWTAAEKDNFSNVVVIKAPSDSDVQGSWPAFQHEMVMHELFKTSEHIIRQVDRIPALDDGRPPMLVLEIAEMNLWRARTKRPLSRGEIVAVVKAILQALEDIHAQGLVYGDLKMENVMVSGFDMDQPGDGSNLKVKIADLGTVMYPASGTLQPIAYRAPEVFFKEEITPAADIWSLGLIYSHLLEAQTRFEEPGIYDSMTSAASSTNQRVRAVRKQMSKDLDLRNNDYYKECALPSRSEKDTTGSHWQDRGLDSRDVEFLERVMKANPRERPTARAILASYWFQGGGLEEKTEGPTHHGSYDGAVDLAVKPPVAKGAPTNSTSIVSVVSPSNSIDNGSSKPKTVGIVGSRMDDANSSPVKRSSGVVPWRDGFRYLRDVVHRVEARI